MYNLNNLSDLCKCLELATAKGYADQCTGRKQTTGRQTAKFIGVTQFREGHLKFIRSAYTAGAWNAEIEQNELAAQGK